MDILNSKVPMVRHSSWWKLGQQICWSGELGGSRTITLRNMNLLCAIYPTQWPQWLEEPSKHQANQTPILNLLLQAHSVRTFKVIGRSGSKILGLLDNYFPSFFNWLKIPPPLLHSPRDHSLWRCQCRDLCREPGEGPKREGRRRAVWRCISTTTGPGLNRCPTLLGRVTAFCCGVKVPSRSWECFASDWRDMYIYIYLCMYICV